MCPSAGTTVAQAATEYLAWYRDHRKGLRGVENTIRAHLLPELGKTRLDALTTTQLRLWHEKLGTQPAPHSVPDRCPI